MTDFAVARLRTQLKYKFKNEVRDEILHNMNLDDVPNMDVIFEYVSKLELDELLEICKIAEVLDWQHVGRIIGVTGECYSDKEV